MSPPYNNSHARTPSQDRYHHHHQHHQHHQHRHHHNNNINNNNSNNNHHNNNNNHHNNNNNNLHYHRQPHRSHHFHHNHNHNHNHQHSRRTRYGRQDHYHNPNARHYRHHPSNEHYYQSSNNTINNNNTTNNNNSNTNQINNNNHNNNNNSNYQSYHHRHDFHHHHPSHHHQRNSHHHDHSRNHSHSHNHRHNQAWQRSNDRSPAHPSSQQQQQQQHQQLSPKPVDDTSPKNKRYTDENRSRHASPAAASEEREDGEIDPATNNNNNNSHSHDYQQRSHDDLRMKEARQFKPHSVPFQYNVRDNHSRSANNNDNSHRGAASSSHYNNNNSQRGVHHHHWDDTRQHHHRDDYHRRRHQAEHNESPYPNSSSNHRSNASSLPSRRRSSRSPDGRRSRGAVSPSRRQWPNSNSRAEEGNNNVEASQSVNYTPPIAYQRSRSQGGLRSSGGNGHQSRSRSPSHVRSLSPGEILTPSSSENDWRGRAASNSGSRHEQAASSNAPSRQRSPHIARDENVAVARTDEKAVGDDKQSSLPQQSRQTSAEGEQSATKPSIVKNKSAAAASSTTKQADKTLPKSGARPSSKERTSSMPRIALRSIPPPPQLDAHGLTNLVSPKTNSTPLPRRPMFLPNPPPLSLPPPHPACPTGPPTPSATIVPPFTPVLTALPAPTLAPVSVPVPAPAPAPVLRSILPPSQTKPERPTALNVDSTAAKAVLSDANTVVKPTGSPKPALARSPALAKKQAVDSTIKTQPRRRDDKANADSAPSRVGTRPATEQRLHESVTASAVAEEKRPTKRVKPSSISEKQVPVDTTAPSTKEASSTVDVNNNIITLTQKSNQLKVPVPSSNTAVNANSCGAVSDKEKPNRTTQEDQLQEDIVATKAKFNKGRATLSITRVDAGSLRANSAREQPIRAVTSVIPTVPQTEVAVTSKPCSAPMPPTKTNESLPVAVHQQTTKASPQKPKVQCKPSPSFKKSKSKSPSTATIQQPPTELRPRSTVPKKQPTPTGTTYNVKSQSQPLSHPPPTKLASPNCSKELKQKLAASQGKGSNVTRTELRQEPSGSQVQTSIDDAKTRADRTVPATVSLQSQKQSSEPTALQKTDAVHSVPSKAKSLPTTQSPRGLQSAGSPKEPPKASQSAHLFKSSPAIPSTTHVSEAMPADVSQPFNVSEPKPMVSDEPKNQSPALGRTDEPAPVIVSQATPQPSTAMETGVPSKPANEASTLVKVSPHVAPIEATDFNKPANSKSILYNGGDPRKAGCTGEKVEKVVKFFDGVGAGPLSVEPEPGFTMEDEESHHMTAQALKRYREGKRKEKEGLKEALRTAEQNLKDIGTSLQGTNDCEFEPSVEHEQGEASSESMDIDDSEKENSNVADVPQLNVSVARAASQMKVINQKDTQNSPDSILQDEYGRALCPSENYDVNKKVITSFQANDVVLSDEHVEVVEPSPSPSEILREHRITRSGLTRLEAGAFRGGPTPVPTPGTRPAPRTFSMACGMCAQELKDSGHLHPLFEVRCLRICGDCRENVLCKLSLVGQVNGAVDLQHRSEQAQLRADVFSAVIENLVLSYPFSECKSRRAKTAYDAVKGRSRQNSVDRKRRLHVPYFLVRAIRSLLVQLGVNIRMGRLTWPVDGFHMDSRDAVDILRDAWPASVDDEESSEPLPLYKAWTELFPDLDLRSNPPSCKVIHAALALIGVKTERNESENEAGYSGCLKCRNEHDDSQQCHVTLDKLSVLTAMYRAAVWCSEHEVAALLAHNWECKKVLYSIQGLHLDLAEENVCSTWLEKGCCLCGMQYHPEHYPLRFTQCSECSRQFCSSCLLNVLSGKEYVKAVKCESYQCMKCSFRLNKALLPGVSTSGGDDGNNTAKDKPDATSPSNDAEEENVTNGDDDDASAKVGEKRARSKRLAAGRRATSDVNQSSASPPVEKKRRVMINRSGPKPPKLSIPLLRMSVAARRKLLSHGVNDESDYSAVGLAKLIENLNDRILFNNNKPIARHGNDQICLRCKRPASLGEGSEKKNGEGSDKGKEGGNGDEDEEDDPVVIQCTVSNCGAVVHRHCMTESEKERIVVEKPRRRSRVKRVKWRCSHHYCCVCQQRDDAKMTRCRTCPNAFCRVHRPPMSDMTLFTDRLVSCSDCATHLVCLPIKSTSKGKRRGQMSSAIKKPRHFRNNPVALTSHVDAKQRRGQLDAILNGGRQLGPSKSRPGGN